MTYTDAPLHIYGGSLHVDVRTPTHLHSLYVDVRHKIFSFVPNCSSGAVCLYYTGYYADRSYSVI